MAYGPTSIGGYMALSPATKEDIGGVKIGTGINVTDDGTINVGSAPAGYVMTKEWSGAIPSSSECWLKIGSISNLKFNDTIEISVAVRANVGYKAEPCIYNAIFSKGDDASTDTNRNHSLLSYTVGNLYVAVLAEYNHCFAINLYSGTSDTETATSSYGDIFVNLSMTGSDSTVVNFKAFITVKTSNTNNFSYSLEQFNKDISQISQNVMYDTRMISISEGGVSKVNNLKFRAQTSDPGAGSPLETGTVLFVYS